MKPYVICHMMTSVDGRIDCPMTEQLPGVEDYYETLDALHVGAMIFGRVTAELEMADPGKFEKQDESIGAFAFAKNGESVCYTVILDTKGTLRWDGYAEKDSLIIVTSEKASKAYLDYLSTLGISWIACGKESIDLEKALDVLYENFGVKRVAVVGGALCNTGFLSAGLLNEISLLIGAGIDGRGGMPAVFDGRPENAPVMKLSLQSAKAMESGAVWIRYLAQ